MLKKVLLFFTLSILLLSMTVGAAAEGRIAIIFATGGLGDQSFNDSAYEGMVMAEDELGITFDYAEPAAVAEYESLLGQFARTRRYDLIISIGFDQADALEVVAERFPDQRFAIVDMVVDMPNVASYVYKEEERGFLMGVIAGLATKSQLPMVNDQNIIGVIGGMDIPLINANIAGYIVGAHAVNPDIEVKYSYVGDWADPARGKELALSQINQGADIVWQAAGRSGLGVIKAAEEEGVYAIGADSDQGYVAPGHLLTNGMKFVNNTVFLAIEEVVTDNFQGGIHVLGLKEKGLGFTMSLIPEDLLPQIQVMEDKVLAGEIIIPQTIAEALERIE